MFKKAPSSMVEPKMPAQGGANPRPPGHSKNVLAEQMAKAKAIRSRKPGTVPQESEQDEAAEETGPGPKGY